MFCYMNIHVHISEKQLISMNTHAAEYFIYQQCQLFGQLFHYHKLLQTFTKFIHRYKDLVLKFGCTCRKLISNGIAHPHFYGNVVNPARKFRNDPCKLVAPLNKLILKGYLFNTVIRSLNIVFIGNNIDFVISKLKAN